MDLQRKLADFNASIKPTCLSSNLEHISHSSSLSTSSNVPSFNSVNIKELSKERGDIGIVRGSTGASERESDSRELTKSNQFLEQLNYHLVSKYNGRLTNEQIQTMIALLRIISQFRRQIKRTSSQPINLEEVMVFFNYSIIFILLITLFLWTFKLCRFQH
ncbi:unnamed protein product [Schistosoma mattheei]|uniref:Uncharacterized protein n=1 Tax=Schistosoma mattheei TaxID=31246 RepID=A0A3P8GRK8_9TREM|nr:unnamed protein product [Schistosoma mattheei]